MSEGETAQEAGYLGRMDPRDSGQVARFPWRLRAALFGAEGANEGASVHVIAFPPLAAIRVRGIAIVATAAIAAHHIVTIASLSIDSIIMGAVAAGPFGVGHTKLQRAIEVVFRLDSDNEHHQRENNPH